MRRGSAPPAKIAVLAICVLIHVANPLGTLGGDHSTGRLLLCGGGHLPDAAAERFVQWAGGAEARLVVIPTAADDPSLPTPDSVRQKWTERGIGQVEVLHTREPSQANDESFVEPLRTATAVWIEGGLQSRLAEAYLGTRVEHELSQLLARGGAIGGTSAGAAIQSRVMIEGGQDRPRIGTGFDLLKNAIVDQHLLRRSRLQRLIRAVENHRRHLGIGIDEDTALAVEGNQAEVIGASYVLLVAAPDPHQHLQMRTYYPGQRFDLEEARRQLLRTTTVAQAARSADDHEPKTSAEPKQPVVVTGQAVESLTSFDELMQSFVQEHEIPGAALAVAKDGRLVYARGFGYADVEQQQPVQPESLFRIASLSKPITAVAVLQLVEQGKLSLDDRVYEKLASEAYLSGQMARDSRLAEITVRQLLQHTAGWDRDVSIDPMFHSVEIAQALGVPSPADPEHIIRFMHSWQLDFDPGERYAYSNFGYCLLGRLIEQATGRAYEEAVRAELLEPLEIRSMQVGRTLQDQRAKAEVCYYTPRAETSVAVVGGDVGRQVPRPYGAWHLEAMDAHGGWIASAVDLVRFASAVQHPETHPLVSQSTLTQMWARPEGLAGYEPDGAPKDVYYGLGWMIRDLGEGQRNAWHTGHLPGTSTLLVLRHDGLCWAVLFNTSSTAAGDSPARLIDPLVHAAADAVRQWPGEER